MTERIAAICGVLGNIDRLKVLADSLEQRVPLDEFAVVGQKLDPSAVKWLKRKGYRLILSDEPLPFAKFNNLAAKDLACDRLLLLNDDIIIQDGYWDAVQEMIGWGYEVVGAKLLYPNGTIQHYGKMFTLDHYPFHVLRGMPADHPQAQQPRPYCDVTAACVVIQKQLWDTLGGLDEAFNNGYEDDDFMLRAREIGANIGVHHQALATHLESQTTGNDAENKEQQWKLFHAKWIMTQRIQWATGLFSGWRF